MGTTQRVALALTIIGALNWALVGLFQFDIAAQLAGGSAEPLARLIYIIIGVAGLANLRLLFNDWRDQDRIETVIPASEKL